MTSAQNTYSTLPGESVVMLQGASREVYGFTAFPLDAPPPVAGIFMFAQPAEDGRRDTLYWQPLYIGEAQDMRAAQPGYEDVAAHARKLGATTLLVHFCGRGGDARTEKADDLVRAFRPSLNRLDNAADAA